MTRVRVSLAALALTLCLIASSTPRITGDGGEYVAMALNLASFHRPALSIADIRRIQPIIQADPESRLWDIRESSVPGPDARRDFVHFWFYPLLTVPAVWITQLLGITPVAAFTALNVTLLGVAFWVALPRIGAAAALLLFAGPIVWWIDKPHTEPFSFALLILAVVLMRERPSWSMLCAGLAATQNPPLAALAGLVFIVQVASDRLALGNRRFLLSAIAAIGLMALQPAYTYLRHKSPSLLLMANPIRRPTMKEIMTVPFDPSVGLVSNFPIFALVVGAGAGLLLARRSRELLSKDMIAVAVTAVVFLLSMAQATNVHHGATPSISRYAIWLIPLAIPILIRADAAGGLAWRRFSWITALVSATVCLFVFHPAVPENGREPTVLANYVWTRHPGWDDPLPEVFAETLLRRETRFAPVATGGCEKVLVVGPADLGAWPIPCFPDQMPYWCGRPGALCYANRAEGRYEFVRAPGPDIQLAGFRRQPQWVWPVSAEPHVRALLGQLDWWHLKAPTASEQVVQFRRDVEVWELQGPRRVLIVLRNLRDTPSITLKPPSRMTGALVDAMTGRTIENVRFDGTPLERWDLTLPPGLDLALLSLSAS